MMSDAIEESSLKRNPREGWTKDGQRFAEAGDDVPVWPHGLRGRPKGSETFEFPDP